MSTANKLATLANKYRPIPDLATYAGVSAKTLSRAIAKGDLVAYRPCGVTLSTTEAVDRWMERSRSRKTRSGGRGTYDRHGAAGNQQTGGQP